VQIEALGEWGQVAGKKKKGEGGGKKYVFPSLLPAPKERSYNTVSSSEDYSQNKTNLSS